MLIEEILEELEKLLAGAVALENRTAFSHPRFGDISAVADLLGHAYTAARRAAGK